MSLGGNWHRSYGTAPCPICQPDRGKEKNALTLNDGHNGRLLLHCKKSGCDFAEILAAANVSAAAYSQPDPKTLARRAKERTAEVAKRAKQAEMLWRETLPLSGTLAERYLRKRGITCVLPDTLRFHPAAWHGPSAKRFPAMVARVDGSESFAVHRTFLAPDGTGKAVVDPTKMMLGKTAGGAVRLAGGEGPLVIAEGIETALSLASGLLDGPATVWAALSTSGMAGLHLPSSANRLVVATDGDRAGRSAGNTLAHRAAALGWQVSLLPAPEGCDWNDALQMKGEAI